MEIIDNKCPTCKSNLEFNVDNQNWKCKHCRNEYTLDDIKKTKNKVKNKVNELICPSCNAKLMINENIISTKCIYCRSEVVVNKTKDRISMPDKVIPFKISKKDAKKNIQTYINNKKLLQGDFKIEKYLKEIQGIYIPFWLFSNKYRASIRGTQGLLKKAQVELDYVPFDANKHLDNTITKAIEPYNYDELCKFDSAYLSGFIAQKYDVEADEGKQDIRNRCALTIENIFTQMKSKFYVNNATFVQETLESEEIHYALLPIWLVNIKYKNENYMIVVNGQTGKVVGKLPLNMQKYLLLGTLVFITSLLACAIILLIFRWGGIL